MWDERGGRGGVWTAGEGEWWAWGEADGVCGSEEQLREVFGDGLGVWLGEGEEEEGKGKDEDEEKGEDGKKTEQELEEERNVERLKAIEEGKKTAAWQ